MLAMKRYVLRLSLGVALAVVGLIAIAQARHGADRRDGGTAGRATTGRQAQAHNPLRNPLRNSQTPADEDSIPSAEVALGAQATRTSNQTRQPTLQDPFATQVLPATAEEPVPAADQSDSQFGPNDAADGLPLSPPRTLQLPTAAQPILSGHTDNPLRTEGPRDIPSLLPVQGTQQTAGETEQTPQPTEPPSTTPGPTGVTQPTAKIPLPNGLADQSVLPIETQSQQARQEPLAPAIDTPAAIPTVPQRELTQENRSLPARRGAGQPGHASLEGQQAPSVMIEKRAPREIQVGKPCTFDVVVQNVGKTVARNVVVRDLVPRGTQLEDVEPAAELAGGDEVVWKVGDLEPGQATTLKMHLLPLSEGPVGSVATVQFHADASVTTIATKPQLELRMAGPPTALIGEKIEFEIDLSNQGSGVATGVVLLAEMPPELKHEAGSSLEFQVGTLKPGQSQRLRLAVDAFAAGHIVHTLTAEADAGLSAEDSVELQIVAPALEVSLEGPNRRYLERPATYTVAVANPGTAPARNVELTTFLPHGMEFVKANRHGQYDPQTHSVTWGLEELPPDKIGDVSLVAKPVEPGRLQLRVEGKASRGLHDVATQEVQVEGIAAMLFEVEDLMDAIEVGGRTTYEIRVVNQGSKAATQVALEVILPSGLRALTNTEGPSAADVRPDRVLFAPLRELGPKQKEVYKLHVEATAPGDQRLVVRMMTGEMQSPVTKEESTQVYAD